MATQTRPRAQRAAPPEPPSEELTVAECWRRLSWHSTGRLALATDDGVDIFPVTYLVHDHSIVLRSAPGRKMLQLARHGDAAFEIDGRGRGRAWSVVARGRAVRMNLDSDILDSGVRELPALHHGEKFNYVKLTPEVVSGREFRVFTGSVPLIALAIVVGSAALILGAASIWLGR
ncbi:pyridoxamine 5'-phosphate oxidase family protein [Pseudolysinimonas sp.]|uniref:pyridoxamine 5'-phosphate oxidase family protein n=1 Tax=Pseudolysinimonas sp. TaxID=2680009 RepID=UPI003F7F0141